VKIRVVTSNLHKVEEIAEFLQDFAEIEHIDLDCPEYRHDDVGEIARDKAAFAYERIKETLITDDTAFVIDALNGFPGPYAAYVYKTIGNSGILALMHGKIVRTAHFETAIAYANQRGIRVFRGILSGKIVHPRGCEGFGYDPIFEWEGRTLAELGVAEKSLVSHRARALTELRNWLLLYSEGHNG